MSSKIRKGTTAVVPVELDKKRNLRYDFNALIEIEEMTGKSINIVLGSLGSGDDARLSDVRLLIYAGLKWEDPDLTVEETGAIIGLHDITSLTAAISNALKESAPPKDDSAPLAKRKRSRG